MKIQFSQNKERVIFTHESDSEYKFINGFPAFLKDGTTFWAPAKTHIIYNIVSRLKTSCKNIKIDKEVQTLMNAEMALKPLPLGFKFLTAPMDYQEISLRYMYTLGSAGLLLDPGMGKSKVVLDYIALMKFKRSLIVCPLPLLFVWQEEVATHRYDLTIYCIETTNWEIEWEKASKADIVCINYTKASIFKSQLKKEQFDFIHLDEFLIKDINSQRTQDITEISLGISYHCGGSGTLINNGVEDMFAPVRYLERSLVSGSIVKFRDRYTYQVPIDKRKPEGRKIPVGPRRIDEARSILESCCIVMKKDEWLKLPDKEFYDYYYQPSEAQREFYQCLARNYIAKFDDEYLEVDNALTMMSKCYQVSNGFVYISDKPDKAEQDDLLANPDKPKKKTKLNRRTKYFAEQPKITGMLTVIKEKLGTERGIIWYNCEAEYTLISEALASNGYTFLTIKGGTKGLGGIVKEFNSNPKYQFLICQSKSVNYGITILGTTIEKLEDAEFEIFPGIEPSVHNQIFYSCNFSLEVFLQQQDRIHRIGQKYVCKYYRLWLNTPVEMTMKKALEDKMIIRGDMLIDIAEKLKEEISI